MNECGKSDGRVVPAKPVNKAAGAAAESVEERRPAEGNTASKPRPGHSAGAGAPSALDRVREVARRDKDARFTALLHHVDVDRLRVAYWAIRPQAAPGVDGVTWAAYGQELEANLADLHDRVHAGRYRARPSRRAYIPKADGRSRPLGIATLEDKILQRAVVEVLNAVYETDFMGFSYGFRLGRSPHQALDALSVGIGQKKVNWVLDADIRDFFTAGFEWEADAQRFLADLRERFAKFGLELHPDKTRLIEFGRYAAERRRARGLGKPETFEFLGFTHICGKRRDGRFWVRRITISKRMRAKLREVKDQLKRRRYQPIPEQGRWQASVVRGHRAYYAVPGNRAAVAAFRTQVTRHWHEALERRSQRTRISWKRMDRLATRWLPPARVMHPFPDVRFRVRTQGRSPVR